jgi:hypothetical protein
MSDELEYANPPDGGYRFRAALISGLNRDDPDDLSRVVSHDITEILAVMYDTILNLDAVASGYLDGEELARLAQIGRLCGFKLPDCPTQEMSTGDRFHGNKDWVPGGPCDKPAGHEGKHHRVINGYRHIPAGTEREW